MRLLFDLFTPQHFTGGAGEYIRKVFYTLLDEVRASRPDVGIVALVDSSFGRFAYDDLRPEALKKLGVEVADIAGGDLKTLISRLMIDKVFIGAAQYWGERFDVENIDCPAVCVIHDICDEEFQSMRLREYEVLGSTWRLLRRKLGTRLLSLLPARVGVKRMQPVCRLIEQNRQVQVVTVSEFTKRSLEYHLSIDASRVSVLFAPERIARCDEEISNARLRALIERGEKFYLMLSANRSTKNPARALKAFERYLRGKEEGRAEYFVTLGYSGRLARNQIALPYLSESDLTHALRHCYALVFPSFFEGFGYPPIEAMKWGKPVLASNVTSIPEVLGQSAVYFSPFYESDIYKAFCTLTDENHDLYSRRARERYEEVSRRQTADLQRLVEMLL